LHLLELYRDAMAHALTVSSGEECSPYTSQVQEPGRLGALLRLASSAGAVASLIASKRRAFGWSLLPDSRGGRVESAWHALASFLEQYGTAAQNGA
jgi:hypothetical protein